MRKILIYILTLTCLQVANAQISPGNVSTNLELWLKADAGTGTIETSWQDQSGNANDYTTVAGPTLVNDALNFNPTVEILSGGFNAPLGAELGTDWTVFFVSQKLVSDPDGRLFDGHTGNYLWGYHDIHRSGLYLNANPNEYNSGIATTEGNEDLHIMVFNRKSAGTLDARTDGELLKTFGTSNSANGIRVDINQGNYSSQSSDSRVGEMILYSTSLSDSEMNKVESYLAIKYGLSLDHNYLASDGTVLWDYSANTTYHNDVTGIGRDDNSGLDQQKSKSSNTTGTVTIDKGAAFGTDGDFILWGNDAAANGSSTDVDLTSFDIRLNKVWKVAVTGTPGTVDFSIDLNGLGIPTTLNATDYSLLIDGDGTFAIGATAHTTGAAINSGVLSFTGVSFSHGDFFTIAATNLIGPGNVTHNLQLWLKADAGTGIIGTSWDDQSGNTNDYTTVSGPTVQNNAINFNPAIEILSGGFNAPIGAALGTDWTTFFISQKLASDNNGRLFDGHSGNYLWGYWSTFKNSLYLSASPANHSTGIASTAGIEDVHLFAYARESTGGTLEARTDGESLNTFGSSNSANGVRIDINQGAFLGESSDSRVGEMIVYSTQLSTADINKVESYLAIKYGITLDNSAGGIAGDYTSSGGTLLWDASTNVTYHNDVAGIGRDDNSALDQQKSKSSNSIGAVTMDKGAAFGTDGDFLLWGNDAAANGSSTDVDLTNFDVRLNKVWKVAVTGTPGTVDFSIDLASLGIPTALDAADYSLLIDGDGTFATGATAHTTGAAINSGVLSFTGVSFSDGDFFTIAVNDLNTPGAAPGLILWLRADAGVTGTAPITNWSDQSGYGFNATVPANGPDLVTDGLNFNPTLDFTRANSEYLQITNGILGNNTYNDMWVYAVSKTDFNATNTLFYEELSSGSDFGALLPWNNQNLYYYSGSAQNGPWGGTFGEFNTWTFGTSTGLATPNETRKAFSKDGAVFMTSGTSSSIAGSSNNFVIGGGHSNGVGTNNNFDGQLAELIVYTSVPTPLEQEQVQSYLAVKYGLTKNSADNVTTGGEDERDYFAADGTVIWDYSANTAYHNDVAGVGRDDDAGLDQQKSKSSNTTGTVTMDKGGAFGTDGDFLLWGNDAAANGSSTDVDLTSFDIRLNKVWKIAVTGTPGAVNFSIDLGGLGLPSGLNASDYALLTDADGVFATGATAHTTGATINSGVLSFAGVSFTNGQFFTIAATNVEGPGDVTDNLRLWLKADAGVTGTAPITNWEGQWNGYNATVPANGPDLVADGLNFNPTLDFTRSNSEYLSIVNGILGTDSYSDMWVYYVSKSDILTSNTIFNENLAGSEYFASLNVWSNSFAYYQLGNSSTGGGRINGLWGGTLGEFNIWTKGISSGTATPNGTKKAISRDGAVILSNTNNDNTVTGNNNNLYIGGRWTGANNYYLDGQLAELIIYTSVPTPLEQEKIQSYLAVKYGLTKNSADNSSTGGEDERDYFAADGTVIWDYSANTTYHNDVTGIGRDDDAGLDQQKSKSSNSTSAVTIDKGAAFGTDGDFILLGNDAAANGSSTDVDLTNFDVRLNKVWKVAVTGTPGTVDFSIDLASLGIPTALDAADYSLLIDGDGTFATGATAHTTGAAINSGVLSFTGVSFSDGDFFTIAVNDLNTPGSASGLLLWLRADAGVTGTTPITNWSDQSGYGFEATVPTNGPDLVADGLNFNPTLDFTRSNSEYLSIVNGILGTNSYSDMWVYYVSKSDILTSNTVFNENLAGSEYFASLNVWSNSNAFYQLGNSGTAGGGGRINGVWGGTLGEFDMWTGGISSGTATPNGTKKAISRDGTVILFNANNDNSVTGNNQPFYIGGRWAGANSNYLDGQLAELIVYTSVPTPLEQEKVQSYLAVKYGLTKNSADNSSTGGEDERDYFAADGTVIWDYSANTTYHNDVAGVGRDDDAGLDQQKSKSSNSTSAVTIDKGAAFGTDGDFILWGNDAAANGSSTDVDLTNFDVRLNKVWKVAVTGTPGTVNFSIDLAGLGIPTSLDAADYSLLIDGDGTFATGATAHTTGAAINSGVLSFTGVSFSDGDYFTLVTKKRATPGGVSASLEFWLKADAGTGSTSDGGTVNPWEDQLDVNNAIKSGTIALPTYQTNQLNFNPVMDYSAAANQVYNIPNSGDINTINNTIEKSFSIVFTTGTDVASRQVLYEEGGQARGVNAYIFNNELYVGAWNRVSSDGSGDDWGFESEKISIVANTTYLLTFNMLGNNSRNGKLELISEGKLELTNNNIGRLYSHGGQIGLGGMLNDSYFEPSANGEAGNNYYFKGELAEITYAKEYLDAAKRNRLESYLAIKYGITLDQSSAQNYTASDGTVVWSGSTNSSYNNDIAGIAKDDDTELDQLKSKSVNASSVVTIANGTSISSPSTFSVDNSFLIWGHNGSSGTALTGDYLGKTDFGVARVWRVSESGTVGNVRLAISNTDLPASVTSILVSSDPTFPNTVATRTISLSAGAIREATVDFANGEYFTFSKSNNPPVLSNMESTVINYCDGNESLTSNVTVTDTDGDTQTAIITFDSGFQSGEDTLVYTIGTGVTVISQTAERIEIQANVANMQTALRAISYTNSQSGSSRTTANRVISIILNDGTDDSNKVTRTIKPSRIPQPVGIFY